MFEVMATVESCNNKTKWSCKINHCIQIFIVIEPEQEVVKAVETASEKDSAILTLFC